MATIVRNSSPSPTEPTDDYHNVELIENLDQLNQYDNLLLDCTIVTTKDDREIKVFFQLLYAFNLLFWEAKLYCIFLGVASASLSSFSSL